MFPCFTGWNTIKAPSSEWYFYGIVLVFSQLCQCAWHISLLYLYRSLQIGGTLFIDLLQEHTSKELIKKCLLHIPVYVAYFKPYFFRRDYTAEYQLSEN